MLQERIIERTAAYEARDALMLAQVREAVRQVEASDNLYRKMCAKLAAYKADDMPPACSAWIDPAQGKPEYTGRYLVWTSDGPDLLRVEEGFIEYDDGTIADWDEIIVWAEVRKPNKKEGV